MAAPDRPVPVAVFGNGMEKRTWPIAETTRIVGMHRWNSIDIISYEIGKKRARLIETRDRKSNHTDIPILSHPGADLVTSNQIGSN